MRAWHSLHKRSLPGCLLERPCTYACVRFPAPALHTLTGPRQDAHQNT